MQSIGITASLAAAFCWAVAIILFKKSGDTISPMALNLFKCLVTLLLLIPTLVFFGVEMFPRQPAQTWWLLAISGIIGISLADTFFFMALTRIGAGTTAVVDCLYLPFILLLSFVFLEETLGIRGLLGATLVISAIVIASVPIGNHRKGGTTAGKQLFTGILCGVLAISLLAISIVMIKVLLEKSDVLWVSFVRILFGTAGLLVGTLLTSGRKKIMAELLPSRTWRTALPAAVIGNYLAMLAWLVGMKYALVSVAAIVNQLSTIFIFLLSALFLKEAITVPRILATLLAVSGALLSAGATP
jgi:drug/metabolite transporter (DMT)-like permease